MFMRKDVNESFEKAFGIKLDEEVDYGNTGDGKSLNESVDYGNTDTTGENLTESVAVEEGTEELTEGADLDNAYSKVLKFFEGKDTKEVIDNLMALVSDVLGKDSMNKLILDIGVRIDKEAK